MWPFYFNATLWSQKHNLFHVLMASNVHYLFSAYLLFLILLHEKNHENISPIFQYKHLLLVIFMNCPSTTCINRICKRKNIWKYEGGGGSQKPWTEEKHTMQWPNKWTKGPKKLSLKTNTENLRSRNTDTSNSLLTRQMLSYLPVSNGRTSNMFRRQCKFIVYIWFVEDMTRFSNMYN